jgi:hypothetical protein
VRKKALYWLDLLIRRVLRENRRIVKIGNLFHKDFTSSIQTLKKYLEMPNNAENTGTAILRYPTSKMHKTKQRI